MALDELRVHLGSRPTDELVSILRNRDAEEWRPEVFDIVASILASRGLSPAEVAAPGPEGEDVVEEQRLATVGRYLSPGEAQVGRMALEASGLSAWVIDESLGAVYGVGVGTRLQVRLADEEAARAVLEETPPGAESMPADIAEPPCPRCGSREVRPTSEPSDDPDAALGSLGRRRRRWYYDCGSCGHRWLQGDD